ECYVLFSTALLALASFGLVRRRADPPAERSALWLGLACFAALVAFLAVSSLAFDFGDCVYPSRENPYFVSGRLIAGALIPFLAVGRDGVDVGLAGIGWGGVRLGVVIAIALLVAIWELRVDAVAFASRYNAYAGVPRHL